MNYLQITGSPRGETTAKMEVIDNFGQTRICQGSNSIYPLQVDSATAIYSNGIILSCGGISPRTDQCFIYEKSKGWKQLSKMNQAMDRSASIPIDGGMIVTGGYDDGNNVLKFSQIIFSNGSVITDGPELPEPRYGHCLAYDKENEVFFVTGGNYDKKIAWKFKDKEKFTLIETTRMKHDRVFHGCGIVKSTKHSGRPLLVVARSSSGTGRNNCEFYDYTKHGSKWQLCSKFISSFLVFISQK